MGRLIIRLAVFIGGALLIKEFIGKGGAQKRSKKKRSQPQPTAPGQVAIDQSQEVFYAKDASERTMKGKVTKVINKLSKPAQSFTLAVAGMGQLPTAHFLEKEEVFIVCRGANGEKMMALLDYYEDKYAKAKNYALPRAQLLQELDFESDFYVLYLVRSN